MRISRFVLLALIPLMAAAAIVVVLVIGFTGAPFDRSNEAAVGKFENSLGDEYHLDASNLSSTWTFNRDAQVRLSFEDGNLTFAGTPLKAGCYSGMAHDGDVLAIDDAHDVSFASPVADDACRDLP